MRIVTCGDKQSIHSRSDKLTLNFCQPRFLKFYIYLFVAMLSIQRLYREAIAAPRNKTGYDIFKHHKLTLSINS